MTALELAAGVDEEHVGALAPVAAEDQDGRRDAGAEEQLRGRPMTASSRFSSIRACGSAPRCRRGRARRAARPRRRGRCRRGGLDHVGDEGVVALALRRHAAMTAVEVIGLFVGLVRPPLVERERRIGDDDVELHELVVLDQLRVASVSPHSMRAFFMRAGTCSSCRAPRCCRSPPGRRGRSCRCRPRWRT